MARQDAGHAVIRDPLDSFGSVGVRTPIARKEPIALEPPRGHQDEYAKSGFAESETVRQRLGEESDHEVHFGEIAIVEALQLRGHNSITGQLLKALHRIFAQQFPKPVVTRDTAFA